MTLGRKILTGFIICILVLVGVAIYSYKNNEKFIASNDLVDHTNQILFEFGQVMVYSIDAETGTRGFIITGDSSFLEHFSNANTKVVDHLYKVKDLTKDNREQQENIEELEREIKKRFVHLSNAIELRKMGFEKAKEFVASGEGKEIQNKIRKIIDRAQAIEHKLLVERKLASDVDAGNSNLVFIILVMLIISILIIVYSIVLNIDAPLIIGTNTC